MLSLSVNAATLQTPPISRTKTSFYFVMAWVIAAIVICGFSYTVRENLLHPAYARPTVLYVHAFFAATWLPLLVAQTAFVRAHRIDLHRYLGTWGVFHGGLIALSGIAAAVAMTELRLHHGEPDAADSFLIPVNDALGFSITLGLGILWRRQREYHRRLLYVASAILTGAAFGRMPILDHAEWFYAGVDGLLLLGAAHDLWREKTVHVVYRYSIPAIVGGQVLTAYVRWSPSWIHFVRQIFA
jgi:uncharacterized membrane protein YozB (DUF420 family)